MGTRTIPAPSPGTRWCSCRPGVARFQRNEVDLLPSVGKPPSMMGALLIFGCWDVFVWESSVFKMGFPFRCSGDVWEGGLFNIYRKISISMGNKLMDLDTGIRIHDPMGCTCVSDPRNKMSTKFPHLISS